MDEVSRIVMQQIAAGMMLGFTWHDERPDPSDTRPNAVKLAGTKMGTSKLGVAKLTVTKLGVSRRR